MRKSHAPGGAKCRADCFQFGQQPLCCRHDLTTDRYRRRHGAAGGKRRLWRAEIIETLRLAWPMALTQLGQIAMMTTDLMLLGRLGDQVVAATALAHTVLFAAFCSAWARLGGGAAGLAGLSARASRAWCAARCASACGRR